MPVKGARRAGMGVCDRGENSRSKLLVAWLPPLLRGDWGLRKKPAGAVFDGEAARGTEPELPSAPP